MKEFEYTCSLAHRPTDEELRCAGVRALGLPKGTALKCIVVKRSLDARGEPVWRYRVEGWLPDEEYVPYELQGDRDVHDAPPLVIVGAGPAGMFAALRALQLGMRPVILERGKDVHERKRDMAALSRSGLVDPDSNYCFGEGGAGAFSDGKLYTRSSKRGDNREVLHQLVRFGASPDILTDAHPHIGSDRLPVIVENIRKHIEALGGEYHFGARVCSITPDGVMTADGAEYRSDRVILATGHSARDIYEMLLSEGGRLEAKGFALGVRVEHPQDLINRARYRCGFRPGMPPAEYSFVEQVDRRGVFSFCMCPGGVLVPSATEPGTVVLNGMSNSSRSGKFANAGVVVQVEPEDVPGNDPMRLMDFQRDVERRMFAFCEGKASNPAAAPAQRMMDFCRGKMSASLPETSYHPGIVSAPLHELLPSFVADRLAKAFPSVKIPGYYTNAALLLGVESRTSSPVRIPRDPDTLAYACSSRIFPCGEGAGYSGGIVSSAIDGIRCAEAAAKASGLL